ncbi:MAG: hypothetical protein ABIO55_11215 [Ginsengibacter sp.]
MRITVKLTLLLILNTGLLLTSCQKEINPLDPATGTGGTGNTNNIIGEYNFVGLTATTYSSVTVSVPGSELRAVTVSDYITKNNVGTATITASNIMFTGVGYSIDTTANAKTYIDGVLFDDSDLPFIAAFPPTNTTSSYTRINSDSLNAIGAVGAPNPSGVTPTGTVGVKLSWSGDTLLLSIKSSFTQSISQGGVPGTLTGYVNGISKLKKR